MPAHTITFYLLAAFVLGGVAGMRSMLAPALLAITLSRRPELAPSVAPGVWFRSQVLAIVLGLAALGELVVDKLPMTPSRTVVAPFAARLITGALCGAVAAQMGHVGGWYGAICGAAGAVVGTFGMFHARRAAGRISGIRDPFIGAAEDVIAVVVGVGVMASLLA